MEDLRPEIGVCYEKAKREHMKAFSFVAKTTGLPVADQMTIAFYETRMGIDDKGKKNIVQIEDPTFCYLFEKYAKRYLPALWRHDPSLAKKVRKIVVRKRDDATFQQDVLRLRRNKKLSLLLVASRIMSERKEFAAYAMERGIHLGHAVNWPPHNLGLGGAKQLLDGGPDCVAYLLREAKTYNEVRRAFSERLHSDIGQAVIRPAPRKTYTAALFGVWAKS